MRSEGVDRLIGAFDRALRAVAGVHDARRASPAAAVPEAELAEQAREHSAALMRVNHVGEVCAQLDIPIDGGLVRLRAKGIEATARSAKSASGSWCGS